MHMLLIALIAMQTHHRPHANDNGTHRKINHQIVKNSTKIKPILQESLNSGRYIRLSDNSLWEINPKDTPITQSWITPVEITVAPSQDPDYPFKLTNTLTGSSVLARSANSIAPSAPAPTQGIKK